MTLARITGGMGGGRSGWEGCSSSWPINHEEVSSERASGQGVHANTTSTTTKWA